MPVTASSQASPLDQLLGTGRYTQQLEHGPQLRDQIQQRLGASTGRTAPQATGVQSVNGSAIDQRAQMQFRGGEQMQADRLQAIAAGAQKGPGELAVNRQIQGALANQQAQAGMARGSSAGFGSLAAARGAQQIGVTGAGMAGEQAMRDRMAAEQQLTGVLGQGRSADIGLATSQAGLNQQAALANQQAQQNTQLANLQARLAQSGMDDQAQLAYMQQLTGMDLAELQARMEAGKRESSAYGGLLSGAAQGIGAMFMSDRNLKTEIRAADRDVDEMLGALRPYSYRYRDEKHGAGARIGIMAQDLERSSRGRELVRETPEGKGVDLNRAVSAALASAARLHERVSTLESK